MDTKPTAMQHCGAAGLPCQPRARAAAIASPLGCPSRARPVPVDVRSADWSEEVAPFWGEVIKSAFTTEGVAGLLKAGWTTIKGALVRWRAGRGEGRAGGAGAGLAGGRQAGPARAAGVRQQMVPAALPPAWLQVMPLMAQGFQMGLVKFVAITGRKPQA